MSDQPDNVDLGFIARALRDLQTDMRTLQDDMRVTAAIVQRMDGTLSGLVNEIRATHSQMSRVDRRVRDLEAR